MARFLFPDPGSRLIYRVDPASDAHFRSAFGERIKFYLDAAHTLPADIVTENLTPIPNSMVTINEQSAIDPFYGPDNVQTLYGRMLNTDQVHLITADINARLAQVDGDPGPKGDPGQGIRWMGDWVSGTIYAAYDSVEYQGSTYLALQASQGVVPLGNPASWDLMASRGEPGPPGPQSSTVEVLIGVASSVWIYQHNLGGYPVPMAFDSIGREQIGDVSYPDNNTVRIDFQAAFSGVLRLTF